MTSDYLASLRDIAETTQVVMPHLIGWLQDQRREATAKVERAGAVGKPSSGGINFRSAHDAVEFATAQRELRKIHMNKSAELMVRALFVQVFCEYDAFIGRMLTTVFLSKPDLMRSIKSEISLAELLAVNDIDAICQGILDKEVETFRRESYVEQFAKLETKFDIKLKQFPEWSEFVELSQRRNALVHNDGIVSEQYLAVCGKEGVALDHVTLGSRRSVGAEDMRRVIRVMSKIGYMLCHTLWSKLFPDQIEDVHTSLVMTLYAFLEDRRWRVASDVGQFALTQPMLRKMSDMNRRVLTINTAIALKFSEEEVAARTLLDSCDWSAAMPEFRLAVAVLKDDFDEASDIMKKIGKEGDLLDQTAYHEWPLFHKFREREDFYSVYEEIYGKPYKQVPIDLADELGTSQQGEGAVEKGHDAKQKAASKRVAEPDAASVVDSVNAGRKSPQASNQSARRRSAAVTPVKTASKKKTQSRATKIDPGKSNK
ncbi:hypothetical protein [Stenotrophomonas sp.]|uniref:hypothetical protein n=1 Tax=Stenotrophomonas sp. TaxID=69392 RepID=UPI0028AB307A|nr:hypothetical protein [Stenotrophomonas sp.]